MKTLNHSVHSEYVFNLQELKDLVNNAPQGDNVFYVTIGFDCQNSGSGRVYMAKVEGTTGTPGTKSTDHIEGCPQPPGCPFYDSLDL